MNNRIFSKAALRRAVNDHFSDALRSFIVNDAYNELRSNTECPITITGETILVVDGRTPVGSGEIDGDNRRKGNHHQIGNNQSDPD